MEVFKDIKGYEGHYQVGALGNIKSLSRVDALGHFVRERLLRPSNQGYSYLGVILCKNGVRKSYLVHRLVAIMFLGDMSNSLEVNHKNGIKTDNRVKNLEWVTSSYNKKHAFDVLGYKSVRGSKHGMSKLNEDKVKEIKMLLKQAVYSQEDIGKMFGVGSRAISKINTGIRWGHI